MKSIVDYIRILQHTSLKGGGIGQISFIQSTLIAIVYKYLLVARSPQSHTGNKFIETVESRITQTDIIRLIKGLPFDLASLEMPEIKSFSRMLLDESFRDITDLHVFHTSPKLSEILIDHAALKNDQVICDPMCGLGFNFIEISRRFPSSRFEFVGAEVDLRIYLLCLVNLLLNNINDANIHLADGLSQPADTSVNKIDVAFCEPPLDGCEIDKIIPPLIARLKSNGKALVIVPEEFLSSEKDRHVRENLIQSNLIHSVTSLPEIIFHPRTGAKASLIIFEKAKHNKNKIEFNGIDFTNTTAYELTTIQNQQIANADLRADTYALKLNKELSLLLNTSEYPIKEIKDLIVDVKTAGRDNAERNTNSPESVPWVAVTDLSTKISQPLLSIAALERRSVPTAKTTLVNSSCVLVSPLGNSLRPTYFNFDGESIALENDVIALVPGDDLDPDYFLSQLNSRLVTLQLILLATETNSQRISTDDLLNLKIAVPSLQEQTHQALEIFKLRHEQLQKDIAESQKKTKLAEYDIIRITVHDMNNKLDAMKNDLFSLQAFFENDLAEYLDNPIKPVFTGDTTDDIDPTRLTSVIQRLISTWNEASTQLSRTREELQNNEVAPQRGSMYQWLINEIKPLYEQTIEFMVSGEDIELDFDLVRFQNVFRNLIVNAQAFGAHRVVIETSYMYVDDDKKIKEGVRILYKNDGEPFPEDFDFDLHFKNLYQKSSRSSGSGIGGYSINKTVELHNGQIRNVSPSTESADLFPVQIEIVLPITYTPNPHYVRSNSYPVS